MIHKRLVIVKQYPSSQTPAGLLNTEEHEFVEQLVQSIKKELEEALISGDRNKARLLLRLTAALVPSNVLHASTVLKVLQGVVEDAIEVADKGKAPFLHSATCLASSSISEDRLIASSEELRTCRYLVTLSQQV